MPAESALPELHPDCPERCEVPDSVVEVPRPRHAWGGVLLCPNDGCERAFLIKGGAGSENTDG